MRTNLRSLRARVERMSVELGGRWGQDHRRIKISHVRDDQPAPPWPTADEPRACVCGTEFAFRHVVHQHLPAA